MAKTKTASGDAGAENLSSVSSVGSVVYCGPTLPKAQLTAMSVYRGGLPRHVQALVEQTPEIGKLIVPVADLSVMRERTRTPGTEEHRLYNAALSLRGGE